MGAVVFVCLFLVSAPPTQLPHPRACDAGVADWDPTPTAPIRRGRVVRPPGYRIAVATPPRRKSGTRLHGPLTLMANFRTATSPRGAPPVPGRCGTYLDPRRHRGRHGATPGRRTARLRRARGLGKGFLPGQELGTPQKPMAILYTVNPDTGDYDRWVGPYLDTWGTYHGYDEVASEADA